jgi:hypothetical protein
MAQRNQWNPLGPSVTGLARVEGENATYTRAADPADRACCCPATAVVRVTVPPTPARPGQTDLLLCGHHYRVSRLALAAASATVREMPGTPRDIASWIELDLQSSSCTPT